MSESRILILGASGFAGNALFSSFISSDHQVLGVGRKAIGPVAGNACYQQSPCDAEALQQMISTFRPTLCLNAAGSGSPSRSLQEPHADFAANTLLVANVLEALRLHAPRCRYIGISSAAVYGSNPELPWRETARPSPESPYGYHKLCAELLAEEYHRLYGLKVLTLRAFSVYGPGLRKQLFWDLFNRTRGTEELELFGTGQETRDFIYIDDVVAGITWFADHAGFTGEILNLASGHATKISDACASLLHELGWRGRVSFTGNSLPGNPVRMEADITRSSQLGFHCRVGLAEGLNRTAAWQQNAGRP